MNNPADTSVANSHTTSRRTLVKGAAWSIPVIASAISVPSAAASTQPLQVDLYSISRNPSETNDTTTLGGVRLYQGVRQLTFVVTYGNNGPDTMPAGAQIEVSLPFNSLWGDDFTIQSISGGQTLTALPTYTNSVTPDKADNPTMVRRNYPFLVNSPMPSGSSFNLTFTITLNDSRTTASNFYKARTSTDILTLGKAQDTEVANNKDFSNEYLRYNADARVDLSASVTRPTETRSGINNEVPYWNGPQDLTFVATYRNDGPGALPEGSEIFFQLPFTAAWNNNNAPSIVNNPRSISLSYSGVQTIDIGTDSVSASAYRWTFVVNEAIASGSSFAITFRKTLTTQTSAGTNNLRAKSRAGFLVGSTGAIETDASNNTGESDFFRINQ